MEAAMLVLADSVRVTAQQRATRSQLLAASS